MFPTFFENKEKRVLLFLRHLFFCYVSLSHFIVFKIRATAGLCPVLFLSAYRTVVCNLLGLYEICLARVYLYPFFPIFFSLSGNIPTRRFISCERRRITRREISRGEGGELLIAVQSSPPVVSRRFLSRYCPYPRS